MLESYLDDLRNELAHRLPKGDIPIRMAEVEAHLREGIECRMGELGMSASEATEDAMLSFGEIRHITRAMQRQALARLNALAALLLILAQICLALCSDAAMLVSNAARVYVWFALGFLLAAVVSVVGFVVVSFACRRPAPLRTLGISVAACALLWMLHGVLWLQPGVFGGSGTMARWDADAALRALERGGGNEAQIGAIERARSAYMQNLGANLDGAVQWGSTTAAWAVSINLAFGTLGALAVLTRRRPKDGRKGFA